MFFLIMTNVTYGITAYLSYSTEKMTNILKRYSKLDRIDKSNHGSFYLYFDDKYVFDVAIEKNCWKVCYPTIGWFNAKGDGGFVHTYRIRRALKASGHYELFNNMYKEKTGKEF